MELVVDTSAVMAVILNEPTRPRIIEATQGVTLAAPSSLHWEVGTALSALFKRHRITLDEALRGLDALPVIPIQSVHVSRREAVELAHRLDVYAYDAYMIACALELQASLLTLDRGLMHAARRTGVPLLQL